jgi:ubiquinone/menaquinone biosynthesis C-methylase UbiE
MEKMRVTNQAVASVERSYVLGTEDDEIARLGLQHAVWRPRVLDAWRNNGFTAGQRVVDVGCGPGYASLDLAELVGPQGKVMGVDRSARFLRAAREKANERSLPNCIFQECDLDRDDLPVREADGAWCRWIFAFVTQPRSLVARIHRALKPGARLVIHEYFDYATWRLAPRSEIFETFVAAVMRSWRNAGGEPDIALWLPAWLEQLGFAVDHVTPIVDAVTPSDFVWQWPAAFVRTSLPRLVASGDLGEDQAEAVAHVLADYEDTSWARMITPGVLEISATRLQDPH